MKEFYMKSGKFPYVYFDVAIDEEPVGRIVFKLFDDVPYTADNFI